MCLFYTDFISICWMFIVICCFWNPSCTCFRNELSSSVNEYSKHLNSCFDWKYEQILLENYVTEIQAVHFIIYMVLVYFLSFFYELLPSMSYVIYLFILFYFENAASYQNPQGGAQNENDPNNTTVRISL